ncbi:MAG: hypothetical protein H6Q26_1715, partial [Bacteroidetes bacterium]|nr:hypothetical protein [Bacteroidota bacterium]
ITDDELRKLIWIMRDWISHIYANG